MPSGASLGGHPLRRSCPCDWLLLTNLTHISLVTDHLWRCRPVLEGCLLSHTLLAPPYSGRLCTLCSTHLDIERLPECAERLDQGDDPSPGIRQRGDSLDSSSQKPRTRDTGRGAARSGVCRNTWGTDSSVNPSLPSPARRAAWTAPVGLGASREGRGGRRRRGTVSILSHFRCSLPVPPTHCLERSIHGWLPAEETGGSARDLT